MKQNAAGTPPESDPRRLPSIRDVARAAGVSHQTVSRVLNAHPSIRDQTRIRVLEAMADLDYRPNRAARMLATARSHTIGVLAASASTLYGPASSVSGIEDAAREAGYTATVAHLQSVSPEDIAEALGHLAAQDVEGIVLIAPQLAVLEALSGVRIRVPFVTLTGGAVDAGHLPFVDQVAGARAATQHLIDLGHHRISHIAGPSDWIESRDRRAGFDAALAAGGLRPGTIIEGDWTAESGYFAAQQLRDVSAIFSANDQMALGTMHALREAGIDIPGDVSVVGFDDIPESAHFWPPLTTVRLDFQELGRRCLRSLIARLREVAEPETATLQPELVIRASTTETNAERPFDMRRKRQ